MNIPPNEAARLSESVAKLGRPLIPGKRVYDENRCDECCNGDRCDDPSHRDRRHCPYCAGTGWALWLPEFAQYLTKPPRTYTAEEVVKLYVRFRKSAYDDLSWVLQEEKIEFAKFIERNS